MDVVRLKVGHPFLEMMKHVANVTVTVSEIMEIIVCD